MAQAKSQQSKNQSANRTQANHSPAGLDDLGVGETATGIPDQVTNTVHAVVGERHGHGSLEEDLGEDREGTEGGNGGGRAEVPAEHGRSEVGSRIEVEAAGQGDTGDTVQTTADPGDLGLVDGKVGSDGAAQTLLSKELVGVGGGRAGSSLSNPTR